MIEKVRDVIIDTDPGIDDSLALIMALTSSALDVRAITVVGGNCAVDQCVHNALCIAELVERPDIPIFRGADESLTRGTRRYGSNVHGASGLGNAVLPEPLTVAQAKHASYGLIDTIMHNSNQVTVVSIAPLTNLALALKSEPMVAEYVSEIIVMGGAVTVRGNCTEYAECNIYNDPEAAQIVFSSGIPVTLVPLDVTRRAVIEEGDFEKLLLRMPPNSVTKFLQQVMSGYFKERPGYSGTRTAILHDPLALAAAIDNEVIRVRAARVQVELEDHERTGEIKEVRSEVTDSGLINVAYDVDVTRFLQFFSDLMCDAAARQPNSL